MPKICWVCFVSFFSFSTLVAQNAVHQELLWVGYNLQTKINQKYAIKQEFEYRAYWFPWRQHVFLSRAQLERKIFTNIDLAIGFTYFLQSMPNDPLIKDFENKAELRPQLNVTLHQKLSEKWKLLHRYQTEFRFLENQENLIKYSTNRSRYKFEVNYLLNEQIKIKAYDEILLNINQQKNNIFDQNRIGLGVQYKPKENYALEIGYINWFQPINSTTEYYNRHIIRITLLHYLKF